jgi:hypothetical protein
MDNPLDIHTSSHWHNARFESTTCVLENIALSTHACGQHMHAHAWIYFMKEHHKPYKIYGSMSLKIICILYAIKEKKTWKFTYKYFRS